jgi:pimeloyl-ACP methyl ester carboxylesterase
MVETMRDELMEIQGEDGLMRRGVVTFPDNPRRSRVGMLLLPAGLKYRAGPHLFYVKLARALARKGYTTLRYDPLGIGESDGCLESGPTKSLWQTVEQGRYVGDCLMAMDYMHRQLGLEQVVAGGICGGAVTAVLAAYQSKQELSGVCSINIAVSKSIPVMVTEPMMGRARIDHYFNAYMKKLASPAAWHRLLNLESNLHAIGRTIIAKASRPFLKNVSERMLADPRINHLVVAAVDYLRKEKFSHLLLFSGNDNRWLEFEDLVIDSCYQGNFANEFSRVVVIDHANHELQLAVWQDQAIDTIGKWMAEIAA